MKSPSHHIKFEAQRSPEESLPSSGELCPKFLLWVDLAERRRIEHSSTQPTIKFSLQGVKSSQGEVLYGELSVHGRNIEQRSVAQTTPEVFRDADENKINQAFDRGLFVSLDHTWRRICSCDEKKRITFKTSCVSSSKHSEEEFVEIDLECDFLQSSKSLSKQVSESRQEERDYLAIIDAFGPLIRQYEECMANSYQGEDCCKDKEYNKLSVSDELIISTGSPTYSGKKIFKFGLHCSTFCFFILLVQTTFQLPVFAQSFFSLEAWRHSPLKKVSGEYDSSQDSVLEGRESGDSVVELRVAETQSVAVTTSVELFNNISLEQSRGESGYSSCCHSTIAKQNEQRTSCCIEVIETIQQQVGVCRKEQKNLEKRSEERCQPPKGLPASIIPYQVAVIEKSHRVKAEQRKPKEITLNGASPFACKYYPHGLTFSFSEIKRTLPLVSQGHQKTQKVELHIAPKHGPPTYRINIEPFR